MIRSKYFGLAAVAFAMLSLGACTTDSNDNNLAISGNPRLDNSTLTAGGAAVSIRGTITNDAGNISYTLKVQNSTTGADATSSFVLAYKAPTTSETSWSIGDPAQGAGTITALASAATGAYNLVISATSGTATTSATIPFAVTGGTTGTKVTSIASPVTISTWAGSTAGSFLSLQDGFVYAKGDGSAAENASHVDLVYTIDNGKALNFYSPTAIASAAVSSSLQSFVASSGIGSNSTKIFAAKNSYATYSTAESIQAEVAADVSAGGSGSSAVVTEGGVYVVQYGGSHYAVIKVNSLTTNDATKGDIDVSITYAN